MSNLTPKNGTLPVNATNDFWGDMDQKDFAIPHVSIGQPTSKSGEAGHFNFNNGKSIKEFNNCKLIVPKKTRVLYGKNYTDASVCGSDNFYQPAARFAKPVSSNCLTCPASQWGDEDPVKKDLFDKYTLEGRGNLRNPLCKETYSLLMADEAWSPFFIKFQGTQLKVVSEKLFSRLRFDFGECPPYAVGFDMKLEKQSAGNNVYYSVVFEGFRVIDDHEAGAKMHNAYSSKAEQMLSEEHAKMDIEKDVGPPVNNDSEVPF